VSGRSSHAAHVVVLAAGRGSRLGALGGETPKWLLPVGGRPIADRHLAGIAAAAGHVASARVVTGHAGPAIERFLAGRDGVPAVQVVANPDFEALNNWWSLLLALRELPEDGPVVVVNGDLLTHPDWLSGFLADVAGGAADGVLAVDTQRELTDESMKVALAPDGTLARIGKVGIEDPVGEYVGILAVRGPVLRALRARLEEFVGRPEAANEWYEGAIGRTAADGVPWHIWATPGSGWVEIDDDDDLSAAQALAGPPSC
jgi:choline kinase